jgi:hypothetical protein
MPRKSGHFFCVNETRNLSNLSFAIQRVAMLPALVSTRLGSKFAAEIRIGN